jgi:Fic family protein
VTPDPASIDFPVPPEPLQNFAGLSASLRSSLELVDQLLNEYGSRKQQGRILPNLVEALRIELTFNSNAIEGSTLTLRQTQLVVEGTVPPGNPSMRELYEARNHDLALRMIETWAAELPARSNLSEQDILDVHQRVMADVAPSYAGTFRSDHVLIAGTGYVPPASRKFDALIPAMLHLANRDQLHTALLAAELHYNMVAIHPFNDGNGRTARLLMDYQLLRCSYPHIIISVSERAEYLAALDEANTGKVERFAKFILHSIEQSLRRYLI